MVGQQGVGVRMCGKGEGGEGGINLKMSVLLCRFLGVLVTSRIDWACGKNSREGIENWCARRSSDVGCPKNAIFKDSDPEPRFQRKDCNRRTLYEHWPFVQMGSGSAERATSTGGMTSRG